MSDGLSMQFSQALSQRQEQKQQQILSPVLIQQMKTFQLSYPELVSAIEKEAEDNVCIEIAVPDMMSPRKSNDTNEDSDPFARQYSEESLLSFLSKQLDLQSLNTQDRAIADELITAIDERGFIPNYKELSATIEAQMTVSPRTVRKVLDIVQSLEPSGVGARSVKESLRIQCEDQAFENEELQALLKQLIRDHLDDVEAGKTDKIAKALGIPDDGVEALIQFIRENLKAHPAAEFKSPENRPQITLVPSFKVRVVDGEIKITHLEASQGIQIRISEKYEKMLNDPSLDEESKTFLKAKLEKAQQFERMLNERRERLDKLMTVIAQKQRLFFEFGPDYLVPLLQKDLAEDIGMSSSAISRLVNGKAVDTAHGILLLRNCCPRRFFGKTKPQFEQLLQQCFFEHPELSDQKMLGVLAGQGIKISRRTVAKYRKDLGILNRYRRSDS